MDDRPPEEQRRAHQRSLFWPLILVGVGAIWLLSNLGILSIGNLWALARFWPVLLIAIGLDLILGRGRPWVGALIGVLMLGLIVWFLIAAPGLDMPVARGAELETTSLSEPIGSATSAEVRLDLAESPTTIKALGDSANLIEATLMHRGQIEFDVSGEEEKVITLRQSSAFSFPWIGLVPWEEGRWEIGLTPDLPLDMTIDGGSGSAQLNLEELQLTSLNLDVTSGSMRTTLPATEERCPVRVEGGSGSLDLILAERSQVDLDLNVHSGSTDLIVGRETSLKAEIDGGSGRLTIDVPDDAAVRFTVSAGGSGSVNRSRELAQVSDAGDNDDDTGTWETPGFGDAATAIEITVDVGSGSVTVR